MAVSCSIPFAEAILRGFPESFSKGLSLSVLICLLVARVPHCGGRLLGAPGAKRCRMRVL